MLTRFSLNDSGVTLFRADYWNYGSTTTLNGLFTYGFRRYRNSRGPGRGQTSRPHRRLYVQ